MEGLNGRAIAVALTVGLVSLVQSSTATQVVMQPTPAPTVTAESERWYLNGDPIMYAGNLYYPGGPQVFFNPVEMVRSGFYMGILLYTRPTIEPFSIVYVPLAGGRVQPYERPRSGELAGTAGSQPAAFIRPRESVATPDVPLQAAGSPAQTITAVPVQMPRPAVMPPLIDRAPEVTRNTMGTAGSARSTRLNDHPGLRNSIFVELDGRRWYPVGAAQPVEVATLVRIGDYHGFGVFAASTGSDTVFIPVTRGGSLAVPYSKTPK